MEPPLLLPRSSSLASNGYGGNGNGNHSQQLAPPPPASSHSSSFTGGPAKTFPATVVFLDDSTHVFEVEKKAKGEWKRNYASLSKLSSYRIIKVLGLLWNTLFLPGQVPPTIEWVQGG